jgi:hypothetical protein
VTPQETLAKIKGETGWVDVEWLIARVEQLEKAIESACYRHHIECDKKCISLCPVRIGKEALSTGPKPE